MRMYKFFRPLIALVVPLIAIASIAGCATTLDNPLPTVLPFVAGNWQFTPSDTKASMLPAISGSLTGPSNNIAGLLHVDGAGFCLPPNDAIEVTGWSNQFGVVTLKGQAAGGILTLQGVLAADGTSMGETWYAVEGGACPIPTVGAVAQSYKAINGTYAGVIKDSSGVQGNLTANLSQSAQADSNGNYTLTGQGTFTSFPCLNGPAQLSNTEVTGQNLQMTYVNQVTSDSVVVSAQFTSDGQLVTVTNWTLSGGCGPDSGTGKLAQQK